MSDILSILDQLSGTTKSTEKISILKENQSNELLEKVFSSALNPYRRYNIRKIPNYVTSDEASVTLHDFINELPKFESREYTGNNAISILSDLLSNMTENDAIVATRILKNDMRCGVSRATVNKIWKGLIPTYPCLLGHAYTEKLVEENISWPALAQIKADGMRANAFFSSTKGVDIRGRSGKVIDIIGVLDQMMKEISQCNSIDDFVLDGELIVLDSNGEIYPRKIGNGILNKAIKGTISEDEAKMVKYRVWDIIPKEEFFNERYDTPYHERFSKLKEVFSNIPESFIMKENLRGCPRIEIIETKEVNNYDDVSEYFAQSLVDGEEGIMLKDRNHVWENKRSKQVIKFKSEKECDLEVIGWNEGTGKNLGKLGALVCASSDKKIIVQVGSGYSDNQRENIDKSIIGSIITVKFNEVIEGTGKEHSLFLPRFLEERLDKSVADNFSDITKM